MHHHVFQNIINVHAIRVFRKIWVCKQATVLNVIVRFFLEMCNAQTRKRVIHCFLLKTDNFGRFWQGRMVEEAIHLHTPSKVWSILYMRPNLSLFCLLPLPCQVCFFSTQKVFQPRTVVQVCEPKYFFYLQDTLLSVWGWGGENSEPS